MAVILPTINNKKLNILVYKIMSKKRKNNVIEKQVDIKEKEVKQEEAETVSVEEQLQEELKNEKDKFLRLFAEFENYKKRTTKERIDLFKTASQDVMIAMLPVLDDFERALNHIEEDKEAQEVRKGVLLIYQKLLSTLEHKGLSVIEVAKGDTFNADDHEAVTQIAAPTEELKGKIIDVLEKGYKLGDKVIRFPKVVIGQ
jgi:molecular chaperone GrpE